MAARRGTSTATEAATKAKTRRPPRAPRLRTAPADVKTWEIPGYGAVTQDPLTFFEKADLLQMVAEKIHDLLSEGFDISDIMKAFQFDDATAGSLRERGISGLADLPRENWQPLLDAAMLVIARVPGLLEDLYLLILGIPADEHEIVRPMLRRIDDDTGFGIFEAFIDQNRKTLTDFVPRWLAKLTRADQQTSEKSQINADTTTSTD